jgi:hypothetical protein
MVTNHPEETAECVYCEKVALGCIVPWSDKFGEHLPHTCYLCQEEEEYEAEREELRVREEAAALRWQHQPTEPWEERLDGDPATGNDL